MSGWVRIERDIWNDEFFPPERMSKREAWFWMTAKAAWKDTRHRVGPDMLPVPRGSFFATLRELRDAFSWGSDKRVRTFLDGLEREGMIRRATAGAPNKKKTHITICNYDDFQPNGRTGDARETHRGRAANAVKEEDKKKRRT